MQIDEFGLAATYRNYSDDEIAALAAEDAALLDSARVALQAEIRRRGMTIAQLRHLHAKELHRESRFDQKERIRRRKTALYLLTQGDPKSAIVLLIIGLALAVIVWVRSLFP